jgi:hypothetical protein
MRMAGWTPVFSRKCLFFSDYARLLFPLVLVFLFPGRHPPDDVTDVVGYQQGSRTVDRNADRATECFVVIAERIGLRQSGGRAPCRLRPAEWRCLRRR